MIAKSERLVLRKIDERDAAFLLELMNEPAYYAMIGDRGLRTLDDTIEHCREVFMASYDKNGFGMYLICLNDEGQTPVGFCGLLKRDWLELIDIGYAIHSNHWRKGYAFEACQMVLAHALNDLGMRELMAITSLENDASLSLLKKLGFHVTGERIHPESGDGLHVLQKRLV